MARFLLGWELGANRGHLVRLSKVASGLVEAGHHVAIASQRLTRAVALPPGVELWQAPLWPRLLGNVGALSGPLPNTMGDILVRLGLDEPDTLPALIQAWHAIFAAVQPDVVMSDFAPALLTAARGRLPTIAAGMGFDSPPHQLPRFPSLTGQPAAYAEDRLLDSVNAELGLAGLTALDTMPQLFQATKVLPGTFTELDPYAQWRTDPVIAPSVSEPLGEAGQGEEIFLYADSVLLRQGALWEGLVRSALPVRVHAQGASTAQQAELTKLGLIVEPKPVPFARIAERSRLVMSYGSQGFTSSALATGIPSVIVHYDLEKTLTGMAITRLQLGGHVHASTIQPEAFATSLRQLYQNDSFQRRARELAPDFRARLTPDHHDVTIQTLIGIAG